MTKMIVLAREAPKTTFVDNNTSFSAALGFVDIGECEPDTATRANGAVVPVVTLAVYATKQHQRCSRFTASKSTDGAGTVTGS